MTKKQGLYNLVIHMARTWLFFLNGGSSSCIKKVDVSNHKVQFSYAVAESVELRKHSIQIKMENGRCKYVDG